MATGARLPRSDRRPRVGRRGGPVAGLAAGRPASPSISVGLWVAHFVARFAATSTSGYSPSVAEKRNSGHVRCIWNAEEGFWSMADRFDVIVVGIEDKSAIVG